MPSISSAAKGEEWFKWMVEDLSQLIQQGLQETPPLANSYFSNYTQ
jgi:creatinine amidohydrolase